MEAIKDKRSELIDEVIRETTDKEEIKRLIEIKKRLEEMPIKYTEDTEVAIEGTWGELYKLHEILERNNINISTRDLELIKTWLSAFIHTEISLREKGESKGEKHEI